MATAGIAVVGAGQGGYQIAASLREQGYQEPITLIGEDPDLPYQRPPLSKAYLLGDTSKDRVLLRQASFYEKQNINLALGVRVTALDRHARRIMLAAGSALAYDHLVLATGARNRALPVEGADLDGVFYLRTLKEADAIGARLAAAQDIVIVGAGFIGLELAAVASKYGKSVSVVEAMSRCMGRAVSSIAAQFYLDAHKGWGVQFLLDSKLERIHGAQGRVVGVSTADGRKLPADLVLVGIGIIPNSEIAQSGGLTVANGISVDAELLTGDPTISAIGDCASFPSLRNGGLLRLESVQNAIDQAKCVANRLTGRKHAYDSVPWFWSDQRDLKLQMVGLTNGCDRTVIRGNPAERAFSVFCFRGDALLGIESVNRPADHMFGRRLLGRGGTITPEQAADPDFDLKAHLESGNRPVPHASAPNIRVGDRPS